MITETQMLEAVRHALLPFVQQYGTSDREIDIHIDYECGRLVIKMWSFSQSKLVQRDIALSGMNALMRSMIEQMDGALPAGDGSEEPERVPTIYSDMLHRS
jgi:hypothetical protein